MSKIKLAAFFVMFQTSSFAMQPHKTATPPQKITALDEFRKIIKLDQLGTRSQNNKKKSQPKPRIQVDEFWQIRTLTPPKKMSELQKLHTRHQNNENKLKTQKNADKSWCKEVEKFDAAVARKFKKCVKKLHKKPKLDRIDIAIIIKTFQNNFIEQCLKEGKSLKFFPDNFGKFMVNIGLHPAPPKPLSVILEKTIEESTIFYNHTPRK